MPGREPRRTRKSVATTWLVVQEERLTGGGFFDSACYQFYWSRLAHRLRYYQIALHAYVLLPETISLLLTARSSATVDRLLTGVDGAYGDYFNIRFGRSVRPWSHRRRCCRITRREFVPVCQKYIERGPVRLGLVRHPGEWPWSSYCCNAFGGTSPFLTPHGAVSLSLITAAHDHSRYREFIAAPFARPHEDFLRNRIERNLALPAAAPVRQNRFKHHSP